MIGELCKEHVSRLSDVELVEYIRVGTSMYLPEAVEFALQELEHRGLDEEQVDDLCEKAEKIIETKSAAALADVTRPLSVTGKIGAFLIGAVWGFHLVFHDLFLSDAVQTRREKDRRNYSFLGFITVMAIVVAAIIGLKQWRHGPGPP